MDGEDYRMSEWKDRLADVDDDYLIGLSNKGIVKRAYKDKEEIPAAVGSVEDAAEVKVGEETVQIRFPLGDSKCSCPSRSMCRHIVQAILVLKESCLKEEGADTAGQETGDGETGPGNAEDMHDTGKYAKNNEIQTKQEQDETKSNGNEQGETDGTLNGKKQEALWMEINEYPFVKLKKTLGSRGFQNFVNQAAARLRPEIKASSVITVPLPDYTVKLLSPLEYSTCTCHKKELCVHKAAAILWCQLETGIITREKLLGEMTESTQVCDMDEVKEAAGQMKTFLEELFGTGLSRTSPDVTDYLERLAIISHNAGLARFEGYFRALADSYDKYFKRNAALKTEDIMGQMTRLYRRVNLLCQTENAGEAAKLAGEFRADYLPVGNLDLIGIAMERFQSQNGYAGETIYFLEENSGKWYTYTNARPVFYDSGRRGRYTEKGQAPWGINVSMENLLKLRIHLTGAKCDDRMRLSSSQDTKGEITGEQKLCVSDIANWYYRDFGRVFEEQIRKQQKAWLFEQSDSKEEGGETENVQKGAELVFVRPASCAKAEFSQTGQQLTLPLYDAAGRELLVEVTYSKQESATIRYLERISEKKLPCFLGKIYLRDGRLRMYPVDLPEIEEEGWQEGQENRSADLQQNQEDPAAAVITGRKSKYQVLEEITEEVKGLMEDLYQSGFDTVHDSTLKDIGRAAELTGQYGMQYLSEQLAGLSEEIAAGRHRMEKKTARMTDLYTAVNEYLYLCAQKTAYDRGWDYYRGG